MVWGKHIYGAGLLGGYISRRGHGASSKNINSNPDSLILKLNKQTKHTKKLKHQWDQTDKLQIQAPQSTENFKPRFALDPACAAIAAVTSQWCKKVPHNIACAESNIWWGKSAFTFSAVLPAYCSCVSPNSDCWETFSVI